MIGLSDCHRLIANAAAGNVFLMDDGSWVMGLGIGECWYKYLFVSIYSYLVSSCESQCVQDLTLMFSFCFVSKFYHLLQLENLRLGKMIDRMKILYFLF